MTFHSSRLLCFSAYLGAAVLLFQIGTAHAQATDVSLPATSASASSTAPTPPRDTAKKPAYVATARENIDAVFATPEFDRTRTVTVAKFKEGSENGVLQDFFKRLAEWLKKHLIGEEADGSVDWGKGLALAGEILLWLLAFTLIALVIIYRKRWLIFLGWQHAQKNIAPKAKQYDSALEMTAPLPEDIAAAAERYWNENKKAEALSLLYRGTIGLLTTRYRIDLPQGATEEEVRAIITRAKPSLKDDFGAIARAWLRLAYAHRPPSDIAALLAGFRRLQRAEEAIEGIEGMGAQ